MRVDVETFSSLIHLEKIKNIIIRQKSTHFKIFIKKNKLIKKNTQLSKRTSPHRLHILSPVWWSRMKILAEPCCGHSSTWITGIAASLVPQREQNKPARLYPNIWASGCFQHIGERDILNVDVTKKIKQLRMELELLKNGNWVLRHNEENH
jgi:hypothetical protein